MNDANPFQQLIVDLIGRDAAVAIPVAGNDYFVRVHGRLVQLQHLPQRGLIVLSTMIYAAMDEEDVADELIAGFNSHHLFRGGYCLMVDQASHSPYVAQSRSIASLDGDRLADVIVDFVDRCAACSAWYVRGLLEKTSPCAEPGSIAL